MAVIVPRCGASFLYSVLCSLIIIIAFRHTNSSFLVNILYKNLIPVLVGLRIHRYLATLLSQSRRSARLFLWSSELGPLTCRRVCPPPLVMGGGTHWLAGEGGGPNSDEGTNIVVLKVYMYFVPIILNSPASIRDGTKLRGVCMHGPRRYYSTGKIFFLIF
jgi:hypothetical protein